MPAPYNCCTYNPRCSQEMVNEGRSCVDCTREHEDEIELVFLRARVNELEAFIDKAFIVYPNLDLDINGIN